MLEYVNSIVHLRVGKKRMVEQHDGKFMDGVRDIYLRDLNHYPVVLFPHRLLRHLVLLTACFGNRS